MTLQEAISEASMRPIHEIAYLIIERKDQRGTCGAMQFVIDIEPRRLEVTDWESNQGSVPFAKLTKSDIMANDWVISYLDEDKSPQEESR